MPETGFPRATPTGTSDGIAHTAAVTLLEDDLLVTLAGFEDLAGGAGLAQRELIRARMEECRQSVPHPL